MSNIPNPIVICAISFVLVCVTQYVDAKNKRNMVQRFLDFTVFGFPLLVFVVFPMIDKVLGR